MLTTSGKTCGLTSGIFGTTVCSTVFPVQVHTPSQDVQQADGPPLPSCPSVDDPGHEQTSNELHFLQGVKFENTVRISGTKFESSAVLTDATSLLHVKEGVSVILEVEITVPLFGTEIFASAASVARLFIVAGTSEGTTEIVSGRGASVEIFDTTLDTKLHCTPSDLSLEIVTGVTELATTLLAADPF